MMRRLVAGSLLTLALASPLAAGAQSSDGTRAIELGKAGLELYGAGKFGECAAKFEAADSLSHSPVFRLYKARCLRGDKKLMRAVADYRAVVDEKLAPEAPGPWLQAQGDAKVELAQAEAAIPKVVVQLKGGAAKDATLTIDDAPAPLGEPVSLDPGLHKAVVTLGAATKDATFELRESQAQALVEIALGASPAGGDGAGGGGGGGGAGAGDSAGKPTPDAPSAPGLVPGAVLLGVGGAAAIVGAVLGGLALSDYNAMTDAHCRRTDAGLAGCDSDKVADFDLGATDAKADASTGLLISGGVVAAVGLVLIVALPAPAAPQVKAGALAWRF